MKINHVFFASIILFLISFPIDTPIFSKPTNIAFAYMTNDTSQSTDTENTSQPTINVNSINIPKESNTISIVTLIISGFAIAISLGTLFISAWSRWTSRYWSRWFELARMVNEKPHLVRVWCSKNGYCSIPHAFQSIGSREKTDAERVQERVFVEMYIDFFLEIKNKSKLGTYISGQFTNNEISISNKNIHDVWINQVRHEYGIKNQTFIDKEVAKLNGFPDRCYSCCELHNCLKEKINNNTIPLSTCDKYKKALPNNA
jgi:hypothetical protein